MTPLKPFNVRETQAGITGEEEGSLVHILPQACTYYFLNLRYGKKDFLHISFGYLLHKEQRGCLG